MQNFNLPSLGAGAGLRYQHIAEILKTKPAFNWFEIINEDFYAYGGIMRENLQELTKHYPVIGHSVGLSLGSSDPLDLDYLKQMRDFLNDIKAPWTSDHLCFTMIDHSNLNELLPLPFTKECVENVVNKIKKIQDVFGIPFLIENVTRYITVSDSEMSEQEFISNILEQADCGLLLDITNVYLNSKLFNFDAFDFIKNLPLNRVGQIHLAGSTQTLNDIQIDSHNAPVDPFVWSLLQKTLKLTGKTSILIEWDADLPSCERLLEEAQIADQIMSKVC